MVTNESTPWITVVITTYDRWPLVAEAVGSVLVQGAAGVEVVVVDDGSHDGTPDLLRAQFPGLTVVEQPNAERGAARNEGARRARGGYVTFLDSDDVFDPDHLAVVRRAVDGGAPVVAAPGAYWDPDSGVVTPIPTRWKRWGIRRASLLGMVVPLQGLVVRKDVFDEVGGFPEPREGAGSEDWVLLLRLARIHPVVELERPTVRLRTHGGRSMNDPDRIIASRRFAAGLVVGDAGLGLDPSEAALVHAGVARFAAAHLYEAGRSADARRALGELRGLGPRLALEVGGRLWALTLLGPGPSRWARAAKQRGRAGWRRVRGRSLANGARSSRIAP